MDDERDISAKQKEQNIIAIAAFSFALVSWAATAKGMQEYVFSSGVDAALISFGIQSILFVFNLRLPHFYKAIGKLTPSEKRGTRRNGRDKTTTPQKLLIVFYTIILLTSSFFSFVYICNAVVYERDSGYQDDDTILENTYRLQLDEVEKTVDENLRVLPLLASKELAGLQEEMGKAGILEENSLTLEELELEEQNAKTDLNSKENILEEKQRIYDRAVQNLETAEETRFWKVEEYNAALQDYYAALSELNSAKQDVTTAQNRKDDAEFKKNQYQPSNDMLVMNILTEFLKPSPEVERIEQDMNDLLETIVNVGESSSVPDNYEDLVERVQRTNNVINKYIRLCGEDTEEISNKTSGENKSFQTGIKNKIEELKKELEKEVAIPDPQNKESFENDKELWKAEWEKRFQGLREVIWSVPTYSDSEIEESIGQGMAIDKEILKQYDPVRISNEMDRMIRNKLTDINVIERVCLLYVSKYKLTAIISALIALELDIASLLAGLVSYWMWEADKKNRKMREV